MDWADYEAKKILDTPRYRGDEYRLLSRAIREARKDGWQDCLANRFSPTTSELINTVDTTRRPIFFVEHFLLAIISCCKDGRKNINWLPVIEGLADEALKALSPLEKKETT